MGVNNNGYGFLGDGVSGRTGDPDEAPPTRSAWYAAHIHEAAHGYPFVEDCPVCEDRREEIAAASLPEPRAPEEDDRG